MKPICAKKYAPTKQIQLIINKNTIQFINDLLENDNSFKVKSSALNAILVTAYNASCLKALCSQLESNNECHLKTTLLAISVFLFEEYKDLLKAEKSRPNPTINLSHFALIIRECDGFRLLNEINERRVHKERVNEKYIVSEAERYVEEILFLAFGVESRPKKRQPKMEMMKNYKSVRTCLDCTLRLADTDIFECNHIQLCCKCAASALHKIYTQEPKQCQRDNCTKKIPKNDCPWYLFKGKLFGYYNDLQTRVEDRLEPEVTY
ncbi:unnamed protein product [Oppiella nova]|uniref:Uncharacterized protein n=1 Tax=Oppiella nova TaxID=334625 RepID=A0A7R9LC09_9ACAR|nr:unnamed protein product [Oppiella nova]CAG2161513.1 unnamed protein product [Oppiella nova]